MGGTVEADTVAAIIAMWAKKIVKIDVASKEAGEEPEGPPSKSKSANSFANEAGIVASSAKRM